MNTTLAGLTVHTYQADPSRLDGAVVLCHGFGAPGDDLVGLAPEIVRRAPALKHVRFYFPEAPISLGNMGWAESRAWWLIDMEQIQRLRGDEAALRAFREQEPEGMAKARSMLLKLVDEIAVGTKLSRSRIAFGGFSQGAMLSTDVALRLEEAPAALVAMSGTLLTESVWRAKAKARNGLHVFQSHGRFDPILPFKAAEWLHTMFIDAGMTAEFVPFDDGHTIPLEVVERVAGFLAKRLG